MNKKTLLLVPLVAVALVGCGGNGGSADAVGPGADTDATGTVGAATNGSNPQGNNPGAVPSPILGEVTDLDVSTFSSPAGYKVYAGDAIDPDASPSFERFVEHAYLNLEFPCNGGVFGNVEAYPTAQFGGDAVPYAGIFSWTAVDASLEEGSIVVRVLSVTSGEDDNTGNTFSLDGIANGSLIVGSSLIEDLIVTRIVQFDSCG